MHFLKTLFFQWAPFMIIHELTRILRNKLVVFNISFSGGTATPTSTLRLETLNRDMSPNSRVTNLDRFHYSKDIIFDKLEVKKRQVHGIFMVYRNWKRKKVRQVTQTSIVSIGENFCDRLGIVIFTLLTRVWFKMVGNIPLSRYESVTKC